MARARLFRDFSQNPLDNRQNYDWSSEAKFDLCKAKRAKHRPRTSQKHMPNLVADRSFLPWLQNFCLFSLCFSCLLFSFACLRYISFVPSGPLDYHRTYRYEAFLVNFLIITKHPSYLLYRVICRKSCECARVAKTSCSTMVAL